MTSQDPAAPPRRYSREQLARLMEIASAVQCECPNHLARIVTSLLAFEDYALGCEDRNPEDARVHRMLYERTARARGVMDQALAELLAHEGIELPLS